MSWIPKTSLKWLSSLSWSIVSNAALRPRRVMVEMWSDSLLVKRSLKTRDRVCHDPRADWKACHKLLCEVNKQLRKDNFSNSFDTKDIWHRSEILRMLGSGDALFWRDLTMARFNESGTEPVERHSLTISVNTRAISSIHWNSSEVDMGSRSQVLEDIFCIISRICVSVNSRNVGQHRATNHFFFLLTIWGGGIQARLSMTSLSV